MPKTYEALASSTLSSSQNYLEVTGIPSTYTDLIVVATWVATTDSGNALRIRFNGDTTSGNYSVSHLGFNTTGNVGQRQTTTDAIESNQASGDATAGQSNCYAYIGDYANTSKWKHVMLLWHGGSTSIGMDVTSANWKSTSAITSIRIQNPSTTGNDVKQYTRLTVYGVTKA